MFSAVSLRACLPLLPVLHLTLTAASFEQNQQFLRQWCQKCHSEKAATGGFRIDRIATPDTFGSRTQTWIRIASRVHNGDMPPRGAPAPPLPERDGFVQSVEASVHLEVCAAGPKPGRAIARRLNRDEYSATVRDLLNVNIDVGSSLPADGAGGEGFDNAAETLFLSPIHAEKYAEAAKLALDFAATDAKARSGIFKVKPGEGVTEDEAAVRNLQLFLPRAFRHPVAEPASAPYTSLYRAARKNGDPYDKALLFALRGVLMSPRFLFRVEPGPSDSEPRAMDDYTLASSLSYFLWGSMPDELLWDLAELGKLQDPEVLKSQVGRMLRSPKSTEFYTRFVDQWLRTRDLGREKSPDAKLFPVWAKSEEVRSDIRYQPIMFFRELMTKDLSVLNLLDSRFSIMNRTLSKLYNVPVDYNKQAARALYRVELPEGSDRGGLLGMPAVLAVSSYPNRTSPVLRGAWILDAILGTPPPPPPPGVPPLDNGDEAHAGTVRERLTAHRANPACASCHSRIDPLGFALENYDALGFWRTEDAGKPLDTSGELVDGTTFSGPVELKSVLMNKKDLFVRNLASKLLGYALGRGLALADSCTVDNIVAEAKAKDYRAHALIESIVFSMPFRYRAGAPSGDNNQRSTGK